MKTTWGKVQKEQKEDIRGLVSVEPGGLMRSAEIHIYGFGGRSYTYEMTLPRGRHVKRHGIPSIEQAKAEADRVARHLLEIFAEPAEVQP